MRRSLTPGCGRQSPRQSPRGSPREKRSPSVRLAIPALDHVYDPEPHEVVIEHAEGQPIGGEFMDAHGLPGLHSGSGGKGSAQLLARIVPGGPIELFNERNVDAALAVGTVVLRQDRQHNATTLVVGRWSWQVVITRAEGEPDFRFPGVRLAWSGSFLRVEETPNKEVSTAVNRWNRGQHQRAVGKGDCVAAVNGAIFGSCFGVRPDQTPSEIVKAAGQRQVWLVVRVPGRKAARGRLSTGQSQGSPSHIATMIASSLREPEGSSVETVLENPYASSRGRSSESSSESPRETLSQTETLSPRFADPSSTSDLYL